MKRAMRTMRTMTINLVLLCRVSGSRRDEYSRVLHAYSTFRFDDVRSAPSQTWVSLDCIVQSSRTELLMVALALSSLPATGSLQQLVIIQRHGERERLLKHQNLSESGPEGGAALTAAGLKHISRVGEALRARYMTPESCGARCLVGELGRGRWAAHELHGESSALARTLGTAEVMMRSLVPPAVRGGLPIPVYSRPDADDYLLRGYAGGKCPMLTARIDEFHASARFGAKEDATREYDAARHAAAPRAARPAPLRSPAPALHRPSRQPSTSSTSSPSSTSSTSSAPSTSST